MSFCAAGCLVIHGSPTGDEERFDAQGGTSRPDQDGVPVPTVLHVEDIDSGRAPIRVRELMGNPLVPVTAENMTGRQTIDDLPQKDPGLICLLDEIRREIQSFGPVHPRLHRG